VTLKEHNGMYWTGIIIWFCAIVFTLVFPKQSDFHLLTIGFPLAFASYIYFLWADLNCVKLKQLIILGVVVRIFAIFCFPQLSDDIYRFIWDGRIIHQGMQPYAYLPTDIVQQIPSLTEGELLDKMNSPEYYTVYPPVSQLLFYLSTWQGTSVILSSIFMKCFFFIAELITLFFGLKILKILKKPFTAILVYWLNPLIIIEGIGNLHFEIIMIAFIAVALWCWITDKYYRSMIFLALSVGSKLLTLLILPYLLWQIRWKHGLKVLMIFILSSLVVFSPLILGLNLEEFLSSIDLYFRKFEFNAGIYYLLRWVGYQLSGYNLIAYIGPLLGVTFICITLYRIIKGNSKNAFDFLYFTLLIYIALATTIHPWYLSVPIFCSVFVTFQGAIFWSSIIWLTYINYSYPIYQENLWVVAIEYLLLLTFLIYESKKKKPVISRTI